MLFSDMDMRSSGASCSTNMSLAEQNSEMEVMSADQPDLTPRLPEHQGKLVAILLRTGTHRIQPPRAGFKVFYF